MDPKDSNIAWSSWLMRSWGKRFLKSAWGLDYCDQNGSVIDLTNEAYEPALHDQEQDLNRLLYVALTRAKHAVFLRVPDTGSALHRLLHDRDIKSLGADHQHIEIPAIDDVVEPFKVPTTTQLMFETTTHTIMVFQKLLGIDQAR